MTLTERCNYFHSIFKDLQATNSIIKKREIVSKIPEWLEDDFNCILEVLAGKHVFGYSYWPSNVLAYNKHITEETTIRTVVKFLLTPREMGDLSMDNISYFVHCTSPWSWFFEPIVNRTLRLGIGKSILPKDGIAPMLAKKYEGKIKHDYRGYILTEKLDGNRCIAYYEGEHWVFKSRNGKIMHVDFDMGDLPKDYIYDGEVMSRIQTNASIQLHRHISDCVAAVISPYYKDEFNTTSGMINRHTGNKDLVYNIFDIMIDDVPYIDRRIELNELRDYCTLSDDIRILPALGTASYNDLERVSSELLHLVTDLGAEGLMINLGSGIYNHKRTDQLLKLKKVQTIDMKVYDFEEGVGKYEGMIGALKAQCVTDDGKVIKCKIGSGLSDQQREEWGVDFSKICGKIVEVAYFSMSQNSEQKGTNSYSLRFPRLKSVRTDKNNTSEY